MQTCQSEILMVSRYLLSRFRQRGERRLLRAMVGDMSGQYLKREPARSHPARRANKLGAYHADLQTAHSNS
jgi:hypothetical protein